jgi:hypothetical protein
MPKAKSKAPSKATVEQDTSKDEQLAAIISAERSIRVRKQSPSGALSSNVVAAVANPSKKSAAGNVVAKAVAGAMDNVSYSGAMDNVSYAGAMDNVSMTAVSTNVIANPSLVSGGSKAAHVAQLDARPVAKPQQQKAGKSTVKKTIPKKVPIISSQINLCAVSPLNHSTPLCAVSNFPFVRCFCCSLLLLCSRLFSAASVDAGS